MALVSAGDPGEAVAAQLAGATVVLPCADPSAPDPAQVEQAVAAAVALASRERRAAEEAGDAAHRFASNASSVGMVAHLVGAAGGRRTEQLRSLAEQGAALAWRAARATRSAGRPLVELSLVGLLAGLVDVDVDVDVDGIEVAVVVDEAVPTVLADPASLLQAVDALVDNARRAGASHAEIEVSAGPGTVVLEVRDDGTGLPAGWTGELACEPFTSGWAAPGDGLGLAVAAEVADDHGGSLAVEDRTDRSGVVARLTLPASPLAIAAGPSTQQVAARAGTDETLSGVLEQITRRAPLSAVLEALGAAVEAEVPGGVASVLLLDRESATLHHGAGSRLPAPYREAIDGLAIGPLRGSCGTAAYTRQEVVAHDIGEDERWADFKHLALPHGLRSCWSTPIIDDERDLVLGTFAVYRPEPWTPDEEAVSLVARLTHAAAIAIRTTELHQQLTEREALFRGTFENTAVGLALVDPDGRVMQANAAFDDMVDVDPVGRRFVELVHPDDVVPSRAVLDSLDDEPGRAGGSPRAEVRLMRGDEPPLWTAMSGTVIPRGDGAPSYVCVELFDLTERRRVAQARREQAMAEAASQAKSELIALVSHELRTPLNAVIGFAQVLRTLELRPDQQRDSVDHIHDAGHHLLQTINDLVDLSGAETGQLPLELEAVSAAGASEEAIELVAGLAADRGIELCRDVGGDGGAGEDLWLRADPHRLRQVLVNLLGNAIKFTAPGGSVAVRLDAGPRIVVADTGCGIAADDRARLFTPFQRLGSSGEEGSGLGLALSRMLARAMGGELGVDSEVGRGSEFWVELPEVSRPAPRDGAAADAGSAAGAVRGRVVYLDDDAASRDLLRSALSIWPEVEVVTVARCAALAEELERAPADLVVLDVELPDGNGWDVLRRLRADGDRPPSQALMLTAGPVAVPPDCRPTEVLAKPVLIPELLDAIRGRL